MTVTIHDVDAPAGQGYYRATLSRTQALRHDNGCLVSIGLTVPDDLRPSTLKCWIAKGIAKRITHEEWNHSGCQSSCILRGGSTCRW